MSSALDLVRRAEKNNKPPEEHDKRVYSFYYYMCWVYMLGELGHPSLVHYRMRLDHSFNSITKHPLQDPKPQEEELASRHPTSASYLNFPPDSRSPHITTRPLLSLCTSASPQVHYVPRSQPWHPLAVGAGQPSRSTQAVPPRHAWQSRVPTRGFQVFLPSQRGRRGLRWWSKRTLNAWTSAAVYLSI